MKEDIVTATREILGKEKLEVLEALFKRAFGTPPLIPMQRYRADHPDWMPLLDQLRQSDQLIRMDTSGKNYRLTSFVIPLLQSEEAVELIKIMNKIYEWFKVAYDKNLSELINLSILLNAIDEGYDKVKLALFYMQDAHDTFSSRGTDFPYGDNKDFSVSESVLRRESFSDVLEDYYRWHYLNPKSKVPTLGDLISGSKSNSSGFFSKSDIQQVPDWYNLLSDSDKAIISEIDKALRNNLSALPVMGLRALIENTMIQRISDQNSFNKNLDAFCEAGYLTKQNSNILKAVINAGHAAMHRSHVPGEEDVQICLDIVKYMMHGVYILKPKSDSLSDRTPQQLKKK